MPPVTPPVGWTKGLQIDIASGQIPTTISGRVPVVLTADSFTTTFISALKEDASDLRFTSDDAGTNFLPRDIQHFDPVLGEIIVHVGLDSVTASTTKTIYAWANNVNASEPSIRDASGSQTTWNNVINGTLSYYGVCHFQKASDSGVLFPSDTGFKAGFESAGNWTPVNAGSGVADGSGPLDGQNAWELSNSNNIINLEAINTISADSTRAHYFEFWIYATSYPSSNAPIFVGDFNRFLKWGSNGKVKFGDSGNESTNGIILNQWNQVVLSRDASGNITFGLNGVTNGTTSSTQDIENMNRIFQDRNQSGNGYNGALICWLRVCRGSNLGTSHLGIQYNSVVNASTFASASNETDFNPTVPVTLTVVDLLTNTPIEDATVRIETDPGGVLVVQGQTDANGEITANYSNTTPQAIIGRVRKSTPPDTLYVQGRVIGTITSSGFTATIPLARDE